VIEVLPMNTVFVRIVTQGHKGNTSLTVEKLPRQEGDLTLCTHYIPKYSQSQAIESFNDRKKCILKPFTYFDSNLLGKKETMQDVDKSLWQPEALYIMCFTNEGCHF
jgi:hypothetical protein